MLKWIAFRLLTWVGKGLLDDVSSEALAEVRAAWLRAQFIEFLKLQAAKAAATKTPVDDRFWKFWQVFMDSDRCAAMVRNHP